MGNNISNHFTRILFMNRSHLCCKEPKTAKLLILSITWSYEVTYIPYISTSARPMTTKLNMVMACDKESPPAMIT